MPTDDIKVKFSGAKHHKILKHQGDVLDDVLDDVLGERLLEVIMKDKGVKQEEIAKELGISIATVQRIMKRLSQEGIIVRNGGKRFGYWTVK